MRKIILFVIAIQAFLFFSCSLSDKEKEQYGSTISQNLRNVIDSVLVSHDIQPRNITQWLVRKNLLRPSSKYTSTYEMQFEFTIPTSENRESYQFEGTVYADKNTLEIAKNSEGKFLIEMNALFQGADGHKYIVDKLCFPEFSESESIYSRYDSTLNKSASTYFQQKQIEHERFERGLSQNEQAIFLINVRENDPSGCSYKFKDNWLEITMDNDRHLDSAVELDCFRSTVVKLAHIEILIINKFLLGVASPPRFRKSSLRS